MEIEKQFETLKTELKAYFDKAAEQQKATGTVAEELKATITKLQTQVDAMDVKMAERHASNQPDKTLAETLGENEEVKGFLAKKSKSVVIEFSAKHTRELFERKTAITSGLVGVSTSGVLTIDRTPGIVPEARQRLMVRDALTSRPTTAARIDFVKVNSPMTVASPQYNEGSTKKENAVTFTVAKEDVTTLATWIPASRQILDDFSELLGFLQTSLAFYVNLKEEQGLLSGSGVGAELHGLITQATAFSTGLLSASAGWNKIDIIGRACQQIEAATEISPTFVVMHPTDWWGIRLTKDSYGRYILGDPMQPVAKVDLFGLTPIVTTSIASGTFLVGSGSPVATEIRDRMGMTVEISREHGTYFTENMVAILAEKRLALITYRPASFISGSFTTSP